MRLWAVHPKYLDALGLVALWREALLAQAVLRRRGRGYARHPQLIRFRRCPRPACAVAEYLRDIHTESEKRGYRFDAARIAPAIRSPLHRRHTWAAPLRVAAPAR
jgi:hypothetical protein